MPYIMLRICLFLKWNTIYKYWSDEELSALKQGSIDSYNVWSAIGTTRLSTKRAKTAYKLAITTKERTNQNEFTNCLNDALLNKNMDSFWYSWRAKCGSNARSSVIEGCIDDGSSANEFAACVANS